MFSWVAVFVFIFGSSQLLEESLKFTFVRRYVDKGNCKGIKVTAWFFRKNLVYLWYLKKGPKWQKQFLNFLESFVIKLFYENIFFILLLTSILQKVLVLENFSLWIMNQKDLNQNITLFCKFNMLAFCNDFLVEDVTPWA